MMFGKSTDSNQSGEPQLAQKQRTPLPELNFVIAASFELTESLSASAIAQTAGVVPAYFLQLLQ